MIRLFLFSFLFTFTSPLLALEFLRDSHTSEINFSDEGWQLIKDAIFSDRLELAEWENKFDFIFPEQSTYTLKKPSLKKRTPSNTYRTCPLCGKSVSKISVHLRYHKDEYNYPCNQCPQMFKEACNLSKHQQRHEKKRALESENSHHPSAKRISTLNTTQLHAAGKKTADETDQEDPEAYLNPELQGSEYSPTESAKPVLGKLSLRGKEVSDASDPRLARSLERMAQNPEQAAVLPNHLRLEFKVKKYTPTQPAIDLAKTQSLAEKKKHVHYPDLGLSNLKKFTCSNCSATYKCQAFLEKHRSECVSQPKELASAVALSAVYYLAGGKTVAPLNQVGLRPQLDHTLPAEPHELKKREKKFKCTLCERKYDRISLLNSHLKTCHSEPLCHSEPQKFQCPVSSCKMSIKELQHFKDHILGVHTKYILYKCKVPGCTVESNHAGTFNRHMKRCHQSTATTKLSLEKQIEIAATLEPFLKDFKFTCQTCNALFPTQKSLEAHHAQTAHQKAS